MTDWEEQYYGSGYAEGLNKEEEMIPLSFFIRYMDAVRENWDEITLFKQSYQDDYKDGARAALQDMSQEDERLLWRATSKGSVFTTAERGWFKK